MPLPNDDILCRFIRDNDWSARDNRPKTGAFKYKNRELSVWHKERLESEGVDLKQLRLAELSGSGQALHSVEQYFEARQVAEENGDGFEMQVEFRPEDEYVSEAWRQWRYAHAQVEIVEGPEKFPLVFRAYLARRYHSVIPPDKYLPDS